MLRRSVRFSTQVLLLQLGILVVVCASGFGLMALLLRQDLIAQYKVRALAIARTVAADGRNAEAVVVADPTRAVQARAEAVRRRTGALFVVVTDKNGIRYSHPETALLGKPVAADQAQALGGSEVTTFGSSAVGDSARAKVPLRDASGAVVGEVIVAISARDVNTHLLRLLRGAAAFLGIALAVGTAGAIALTRRVKRQTMGLEPSRLRLLFEQQDALRRVATLVARGVSAHEVFQAVTDEVANVLGAESTSLLRYESAPATTVAATSRRREPVAHRAERESEHDGVAAAVAHTRRAVRVDRPDAPETQTGQPELWCVVGAPVVVEGELWGVIISGWSDRLGVPVDADGRMAEFTDLVATAIANANSRAELAASRARVVAAADDARRRIERDLHDGAQQRLVALGLELRAAETSVPPELTELDHQLSRASSTLADAIAELQEVSRGIHPAVLSRGGLGPALRALGRRSVVPVELDVRGDRRLPDRVEVAAYYVVSEALTNAAKHAEASVVHVELDAANSTVDLTIRDDGIGGADSSEGSGLIGLRDRVEALGGTMRVLSATGEGTSLLVSIPIASNEGANSEAASNRRR
jgi:signal transduction histidine kinase